MKSSNLQEISVRRQNGFFKRLADIAVALPLTLLSLPVGVLLGLLILLRDPGNPFYCQRRVGRDGKVLTILKFRTMKRRSDEVERVLSPEALAIYRREYKLMDDPRLIGYRKEGDGSRCFGAILRRTSLDELPQLWWNVLLCGNMSLVGPRPILPEELAQHYTAAEQEALLSVKPGLTGYWQAYARNAACYENGERQQMELYYVKNRSFGLDLKILFRTVVAVITKAGAK
ncbi:MAG: sugar transferase [Clostridia bacterium]|nr:sugar transferase [Clostridia bacterium]MBR3862063.1 sugar transferase [Clostridia bacterium]